MNETAIISGIRQGSMSAKVAFYHRYHLPAYQSALRLLRDSASAEDTCHDTILLALEQIGLGKKIDNMEAWIRTVARNQALKRSKTPVIFTDAIKEEAILAETAEPEFWEAFSLDEILEAMDTLPEGYRVVLNLYLIEDMDHASIARELDITPATSRSQYLRGRQKLQQLLTVRHER